VRIVARLGSLRGPNRFVVGSMVIHAVLIAAMILVPRLGGRKALSDDALIVELAPAFPTRAAAPQPTPPAPVEAPPPEPEPEPVPDETVAVKTEDPKLDPDPLPPEPDEETEEPDPSPASPAPGEAGEGPSGEELGGPDAGSSIAPLAGGDLQFAWYRASVSAAIDSNWRRPILSGLSDPVEVTVGFHILRDGSVASLRVESPSGVPSLDRSALRAVSDAAPLPALPSNWREPRLEAVYVFRLYPEGL
jgi:protein TonB